MASSADDPGAIDDVLNSANTSSGDISADISATWDTIDGLITGFFAALPKMAIGLVVFFIFWVIAKLVRSGLQRAKIGEDNSHLGTVFGRIAGEEASQYVR